MMARTGPAGPKDPNSPTPLVPGSATLTGMYTPWPTGA